MSNPKLVSVLAPIVSRVRTSTCCVKKPGVPPARIDQPLTDAKVAKHCNGGPAYGVYPMQAGESTTMLALADLDSHKGETPWHDMQSAALRLMSAMEAGGLRPIPFRSSGGAGLHLYVIWDQPQDARSVRAAMRAALGAAGFSDGTGGVAKNEIEVFPKQNAIPADGYGNMFVMPLAGLSVPLDAFELDDMPKEAMIGFDWPVSSPVAFVEKPAVEIVAGAAPEGITDAMRAALDAIPNSGGDELEYDDYRTLLFAVHYESGGSDEGLALIQEFASRSSKYVAEKTVADWGYAGRASDRAPVTGASILFLARTRYNWQEDVSGDFDVVPVEPGAENDEPMPSFRRNKVGEILPTAENVKKALASTGAVDWSIGYDAFRDELMWTPRGVVEWRSFGDSDYFRLRVLLEQRGFKTVSKELIRDAVAHAGDENKFDSAVTWLRGLPVHDGVTRVATFLTVYFGVEDTPYARAVATYLWSAMAGRVLQPGVKADMVPILVGPQGIKKSSAVAAMVPAIDHFVEISLGEKDDNLARTMRGKLIGEIAELRGLQTRDLETVKAFVTRTHEQWVPKFKEFAQIFPRRLVFVGTTNQNEFLADETGNRRWLPVNATMADLDSIVRDRLQLWAEAAVLFDSNGVMWSEAQALAGDAHVEHTVTDTWADSIESWLNEAEFDGMALRRDDPIRMQDVLIGALNFAPRDISRVHELRVGRILTALGFEKTTRRVTGRLAKVWVDALS